jgi:hypothetical protein
MNIREMTDSALRDQLVNERAKLEELLILKLKTENNIRDLINAQIDRDNN